MLKLSQFVEHASNKFVTVTFEKKDGSIRTINGRFGVKKHLKGGNCTLDKDEYFIIYSMKDEGYRAIAKERILSVSMEGVKVYTK